MCHLLIKKYGGFFITQSIDFPIIAESGNQIGNLFIYSESDIDVEDFEDEYKEHKIFYKNIPKGRYLNNKIPIQCIKNSNSISEIYFLEETKYSYSIKVKKEIDTNYFHPLNELNNKNKKKDEDIKEGTYKEDKIPFVFEFNTLDIENYTVYHGTINFKSFAGKTFLDILYKDKIIFSVPIEVRSKKIDYQEQYPQMIADIAEYLSGLLFRMNSPLYHSYELSELSENSPYEEYMLLEYLFRPDNLPAIFEYLSRNLYSYLEEFTERVPTTFASNIGSNELANIAAYTDSVEEINNKEDAIFCVDDTYYIPLEIDEIEHRDIIDVPENRFFKYFLEYIEEKIYDLLKNKQIKKLSSENDIKKSLISFKNDIEYFLSQKYFKDISRLDYLPLNSQVLQKKEGYREILQYFLMFELGLKIDCSAITDDFKGYEKKLYDLYEYWCYFQLANILEDLLGFNFSITDFVKISNNQFTLNLKGKISKKVKVRDKELKLKLIYKSTFLKSNKIYKSNSHKMEPDYTLLIEYKNMQNKTVRKFVHFDAKYRVFISKENKESFNYEDINKMHTYNDAIVNTLGSFVLYPGGEKKLFPNDNDAQVGAFPLNPNSNPNLSEKNNIKEIISKKINYFIDNEICGDE